MAEIILKLTDITACYGKIKVLHDINMEINRGEAVCLIGSNGAGKSTILKVISGLLPVSSGTVTYDGREINRLSMEEIVSLGITQVPEKRRLFQGLSVKDNLRAGAYLRNDKAELAQDLEKVFSYFPVLLGRKNQYAGTLSGGEQQMLALARGLMARPRTLLLDEPSFGLAPLIVEEIFSIISKIKEEGTTILLAEQNAREALLNSEFGYVLVTGDITLSGSSQDLLERREVQEHYLGKKRKS